MTLELAFQNQDVEVLQDRLVFDGHFKLRQLSLRHRLFKGGWGPVVQRELFDRGDAIAVLPIDMEREELILIEQFRPGALNRESSPWMLELIAGVIEEGEDDRAVAHREAEEEAQCRMDELQLIATFFPSAGACSEQIRCFVGRVVSAPDTGLFGLDSEHEDIRLRRVAIDQAFEWLKSNQINNGHTLIALQWLALNQTTLRQQWLTA